MHRSLYSKAPTVTLLSSSSFLSKRVQDSMKSLFSMNVPELEKSSIQGDHLDSLFQSVVPGFTKEWESLVCQCPSTQTIIHLLSIRSTGGGGGDGGGGDGDGGGARSNFIRNARGADSLQLLSIVADDSGGGGGGIGRVVPETKNGQDEHQTPFVTTQVKKSRNAISCHLSSSYARATNVAFKHTSGQQINPNDILGFGGGLPLLDLNDCSSSLQREHKDGSSINNNESFFLRELAMPYFDDTFYKDGSTVQRKLSESLQRPVVGVYQFRHGGLALRPIPAAKEDRLLPGLSLVFQCKNMEQYTRKIREKGAQIAKIGFSGTAKFGQHIVLHPDLPGLDVRLDDSVKFSSSFSEAEDALLAGSLNELQNVNVLLEGGKEDVETRSKPDEMNGLGDCWVEFRANMKAPSGFIKRNTSGVIVTRTQGGNNKVAKAPDLPFN